MKKERTAVRLEKIRRVLEQRQPDLTLVMANIHDPHNVSAIYRSCDAFGVPRVHLYYTDTPFPHLAAKTSASARKWVETEQHRNIEDLRAALKKRGMAVYATTFTPAARPLAEFDLTRPAAVILGNEHRGVDEELVALSDAQIYIPMYGMIQSFNVSVAAALVLYEASRQRLAAGRYDAPGYQPRELEELFATWADK
ncbi:MAG: RNA methyltransferase [Deltaproteobacteria bacterium]|jgi:tRNA (guanosine-2'-O-)-methyltransferase|nr:RNA methyltransferase [Deltaproteobacteria bacterium]